MSKPEPSPGNAQSVVGERTLSSYAHRFLFIWGGLALLVFAIGAGLTAMLVYVPRLEPDYQPIGMYGAYRGGEVGWIYYEVRHGSSDFLVYYPAGTKLLALPYGAFGKCVDRGTRNPLPAGDIVRSQWRERPFYLITISARPEGSSVAGRVTCTIAFKAERESFTDFAMDFWFLPSLPQGTTPATTLNVSAVIDGADNMQVFGAHSTSSSGAALEPDDESTIRFANVRRESLRDVLLVVIGALAALGAAMVLESIRPYIELTAARRPRTK